MKQIAKLQEQINALSLDDSRDAQAKKIKLEEEMAELQKELADDQSDYAVDAQKEALDDMQTAYENEKDAEIKALEETISSYQKLYDSYQSYNGTKYFQMNHWGTSSNYNTNYGGWKACDMRYDILGSTNKAPSGYGAQKTTSVVGYDSPTNTATSPVANTLMAALPSDLRAVMKPITKYTDSVGNSSNVAGNVTASVDYLPLLAEFEIFGTRSYANQYEQNSQVQYDYYKSGNSKVKYRHSSTGSTAIWWERSPYYDYTGNFCGVNTGGVATTTVRVFPMGSPRLSWSNPESKEASSRK